MVDNTTTSASDWLGAKLRATRAYMVGLVGRIDDLTVTKATAWSGGPGHHKLAAWLAEVADLKREEGATLALIEAAEEKGRERRRAVLAAPAAPKPPASSLWFWLILLFVVCEKAGDKIAAWPMISAKLAGPVWRPDKSLSLGIVSPFGFQQPARRG